MSEFLKQWPEERVNEQDGEREREKSGFSSSSFSRREKKDRKGRKVGEEGRKVGTAVS